MGAAATVAEGEKVWRWIKPSLNKENVELINRDETQCTIDPSRMIVEKESIAPMDRSNRALGQKAVLTDPLMSEAAFFALACFGLHNQNKNTMQVSFFGPKHKKYLNEN